MFLRACCAEASSVSKTTRLPCLARTALTAAVTLAADATAGSAEEIRPLELAKQISQAALEAHRSQRAGDNLACAVLDLRSVQAESS